MKKRVIAIVAAIMVMMMGSLTAFAAASPTPDYDVEHYIAPTVEGTTTSVGMALRSDVAIADKAANGGTELWSADINGTGTVKVTANIASVKAGDTVLVVHVKTDKSVEYLDHTTEDGKVSFTMTSFSPVVIYKVSQSATDTTNNAAANTTTNVVATTNNVVSAKTGEAMSVALFAAIALGAVALVCAKKARA